MVDQNYSEAFARLSAGQNLLQAATQAQQLQHLNLANQQAQLQMNAQQEMGKILQGAIDPQTGVLDYNKAFVAMAGNPNTAFMAPDFLDKAIARQGTQADVAMKQLDLHIKQQNAIYDAASGLLEKGTAVRREDVAGALANLYGAGIANKEQVVNFLGTLPGDGAPLYAYLKQIGARAQGTAKTMEQAFELTKKRMEPVEGIDTTGEITGVPGAKFKAPYGEVFGSGARSAPGGQEVPGRSAGMPSPASRGVMTEQPAATQEAQKQFGQQYKKIAGLVEANQGVEVALDEIKSLMKDYHPGAGASTRLKIAETLSALGINKVLTGEDGKPILDSSGKPIDILDSIANGSMSKGQALKSTLVDFATNRMRKLLEKGTITNVEFQTFQNTKPSLDMSEGAINELLQHYRRGVLLDKKYVQGYNWHLKNNKSPADFQDWWQKQMDKYMEYRKKERE